MGIIVLVGAQGDPLLPGNRLGHRQGCLPLCRPGRLRHAGINDQAMAALHQHMTQIAQLGLLPFGLFVKAGVGIGRRSMGGIGAPLPPKVDARVARIIRRWRGGSASLRLKLFCPAQASISVPSTVKCSSDSSSCSRAYAKTCSKKACATSPSSKRSRFLLNVEGSQTGSSICKPTNYRNSRL